MDLLDDTLRAGRNRQARQTGEPEVEFRGIVVEQWSGEEEVMEECSGVSGSNGVMTREVELEDMIQICILRSGFLSATLRSLHKENIQALLIHCHPLTEPSNCNTCT